MTNEQCIDDIVKYFKQGETNSQKLGIELEHFVCDENLMPATYEQIGEFVRKAQKITGGEFCGPQSEVICLICEEYTLTLEPACQLEISINAKEDISEIKRIYEEFRGVWDKILQESGYKFIAKGVHPLVECGEMTPDEFSLIPKNRYEYMNRHFENSGKYGKYMMRATASTQISVDYENMADAMAKLRVLQAISPVIALISEMQSALPVAPQWKKHIIRTQIWNDLDADRCGYFAGSMAQNYSYESYAAHVLNKPLICNVENGKTVELKQKTAAQHAEETGNFNTAHVLSMFFPNVRLKQYLELRVADSMPLDMALGFAALIKGLMYGEKSAIKLADYFKDVTSEQMILKAEDEIAENGYNCEIYGRDIKDIVSFLFDTASENLSEGERAHLSNFMPLPVIQHEYCELIKTDLSEHIKTANESKEYLANSTAKYHNRVAKSMYVPKIFTKRQTEYFSQLVETLYKIFDKVIDKFYADENYRALFGFEKELLKLIMREKTYECNIPISRIDVFFNEQTNRFNFCEFNTDGTSAMNEDRELNTALKLTHAYKLFTEKYKVETFELFDTWVSEFLNIYADFAKRHGAQKQPNVAIVDFTSVGTLNEFEIFKQRFEKCGINTVVCDVEDLVYDGKTLKVKQSGFVVNAIYRRAVTTDVMKNLDKARDMIDATVNGDVCLIGDFKTQIVHNKILYKILHLPQTQQLLTRQEQDFVKAHVPYTTSLTSAALKSDDVFAREVYGKKDAWIIKPEDSYGSKGVHAGVECTDEEWRNFVDECKDKGYIIQRFYNPYQMKNIDLAISEKDEPTWHSTSNLTGLFVYSGKMCGAYSRISYDEMISTQYNEMSLPTIVAVRD